jgi:hypothetical protein
MTICNITSSGPRRGVSQETENSWYLTDHGMGISHVENLVVWTQGVFARVRIQGLFLYMISSIHRINPVGTRRLLLLVDRPSLLRHSLAKTVYWRARQAITGVSRQYCQDLSENKR